MPDIKEQLKEYKEKYTVLYGLGTETKKALDELDGYFKITGLLDGFRTSGEMYGKPILRLAEIIDNTVKLIIVVARPGSCRAITRRIGTFCKENDIALYDIRGKNLLVERRVSYNFKHVQGGTKNELLIKIETAEIVSLDLFDTLVMRKVLSYTDIFEIVNDRLKEMYITIPGFADQRLESEKELAKYGAPSLVEIYEHLLKKLSGEVDVSAQTLADLEWSIDYEMLIPRQTVCNVYREAVERKKIFIITDTYYGESQIKKILGKCGIENYSGIYASCEYHTGKMQKLFEIFKKEKPAEKYLHIGDDLAADVEVPIRYGMDTFHIFSGCDLMDELGNLGIGDDVASFSDRVKTGLFISRIFNNPFQFETGGIQIKRSEDIGYLFCAPLICDFLIWFCRQVKESNIEAIFFPSRDGYLLKKLYEIIDEKESIYFLTSRIAAIRAGMENNADISYVDSMKFSGTIDENLWVRFGIHASGELTRDKFKEGLMGYADIILEQAEKQRRNYGIYIESLGIPDGNIAFFDFVAKGTTQMYVQKLLSQHLKGFYFLKLEPDFMADKGVDIESFYAKEALADSVIFDDYYILELILTAPYPQVLEFDATGTPVYAEETRSEQEIRCISNIQEGVFDYIKNYISMVPSERRSENKTLDEAMLKLIHSFRITNQYFGTLVVEDLFFNRMTDISDLLL